MSPERIKEEEERNQKLLRELAVQAERDINFVRKCMLGMFIGIVLAFIFF